MSEHDQQPGLREQLTQQSQIEARSFRRLFETQDGKTVLAALKRDFGWDAASPAVGKDGEIPISRLRAWTGSRAVIATILLKSSQGEKLTNND